MILLKLARSAHFLLCFGCCNAALDSKRGRTSGYTIDCIDSVTESTIYGYTPYRLNVPSLWNRSDHN